MDLPGLVEVRVVRTRSELSALSPAVAPLGGGTWLYSEPQPTLRGLLDLTGLGWPAWERRPDGGLSVAATCTIAELVAIPGTGPLFRQSAESLLQSFKIWDSATIGGNIATALAAGALIGLAGALDGEVLIWTPDGGERREPVDCFVLGQRATTLVPGEVIRSIEFPAGALRARTAFRRIALSPLGRAGTVLAARRDTDGVVLCITGGTVRPEVLRFPDVPEAPTLARGVASRTTWFTDAHGGAVWRRAVSEQLAEEIRQELAA